MALSFALLNRRITVLEAESLSRLEVLTQIQRWGEVEDSHDVEREETRRQLGSAACVLITN